MAMEGQLLSKANAGGEHQIRENPLRVAELTPSEQTASQGNSPVPNPSGDRALSAIRGPQPTEKPLSDDERKVADRLAGYVRDGEHGLTVGDNKKLDQSRLDLALDLSCMKPEDLDKMMPTINKSLDGINLRMARDPATDQIWVGENREGGDYHLSYLAGTQVDCKLF